MKASPHPPTGGRPQIKCARCGEVVSLAVRFAENGPQVCVPCGSEVVSGEPGK